MPKAQDSTRLSSRSFGRLLINRHITHCGDFIGSMSDNACLHQLRPIMLAVRIFATALIWGILLTVASTIPMAGSGSIPKDRAQLSNGDWFPYVISKLSPLEWWSFAASSAEVRREDYPSDWGYELAKQNTWEFPRFCFSLFRPNPEVFSSLLEKVEQYEGDVVWVMHDNCIVAMSFHPTFYTPGGGGARRGNEKGHPESA